MLSHHRKGIVLLLLFSAIGLWVWFADLSERGDLQPGKRNVQIEPAVLAAEPDGQTAGSNDLTGDGSGGLQEKEETAGESDQEMKIWVYVTGEVHRPGVYQLDQGDRVFQAVEKAGGVSPDGRPEYLNLAKLLHDGEKVWVPNAEQIGQITPGEFSGGNFEQPEKIDLNTASKEQLEKLPGIGPKLAATIFEDRTRNGRFATIDELKRVSGIGPATVERLRDAVHVP